MCVCVFSTGAVSGVDVAAVSAGSVVAVLIVSAIISTIVLVIITHRIHTLPYKQAKEPPGEFGIH